MCVSVSAHASAALQHAITAPPALLPPRARFWNAAVLIVSIGVSVLDIYMVVPSLHAYLESFGADKQFYGVTVAIQYLVTALCSVLVGGLMDRGARFKPIFLCTSLVGAFSSATYCLAPLADEKLSAGKWFVLVARSLMGIPSSGLVPGLVYITRHVPQDRQTRFIGLVVTAVKVSQVLGPSCSAGFVSLPVVSLNGIEVLNKYTYAGLLGTMSMLLNWVFLLVMFVEPQPVRGSAEKADLLLKTKLRTHIWRTGAWVNFLETFLNRINSTIFMWWVPVYVTKNLGWTQRNISLQFTLIALVTGPYMIVLSRLASRVTDRFLCLVHYIVILLACTWFSLVTRCAEESYRPSVAAYLAAVCVFDVGLNGQGVPNNSLFIKLIGTRSVGAMQALFQLNNLVGQAVGALVLALIPDYCVMVTGMVVMCGMQVLLYAYNYHRLTPEHARQFHEERLLPVETIDPPVVCHPATPPAPVTQQHHAHVPPPSPPPPPGCASAETHDALSVGGAVPSVN